MIPDPGNVLVGEAPVVLESVIVVAVEFRVDVT
jgi:hypothetical protein